MNYITKYFWTIWFWCVFKENDQLIGVISEGSLDGSLVIPINSQIADWIDRVRHY
ncbi:hypothetical protein ACVXZZ_03405 [Staphylococcus aureus]